MRGTCSAGHVTETTSDPGRVTWHGTCADPECDLPVYAKRVPKDIRPDVDPAAQTPPADDNDDDVKEVDWDVPQPKRGRGEPRLPEQHQPDESEQRADVGPVPPPVPVVIDTPEPEPEQPPAGRARRGPELVSRLRGQRDRRPGKRVFRHPLD